MYVLAKVQALLRALPNRSGPIKVCKSCKGTYHSNRPEGQTALDEATEEWGLLYLRSVSLLPLDNRLRFPLGAR